MRIKMRKATEHLLKNHREAWRYWLDRTDVPKEHQRDRLSNEWAGYPRNLWVEWPLLFPTLMVAALCVVLEEMGY